MFALLAMLPSFHSRCSEIWTSIQIRIWTGTTTFELSSLLCCYFFGEWPCLRGVVPVTFCMLHPAWSADHSPPLVVPHAHLYRYQQRRHPLIPKWFVSFSHLASPPIMGLCPCRFWTLQTHWLLWIVLRSRSTCFLTVGVLYYAHCLPLSMFSMRNNKFPWELRGYSRIS